MRGYADLLLARADDDHLGLVFEGRSWTWAEVVQECANRTPLVRPGTHVGLLLDNLPDYLFWLGACALQGAALVGINPTRRGAQLEADVAHTDIDLLVTEAKHRDDVAAFDHVLVEELTVSEDVPLRVDPSVDEATTLLLLFTSGSTGAPKAVICSTGRYARLAGNAQALFGLTKDDVLYQSMPMFHGNALMTSVASASQLGATLVLRRRFSAGGFLDDVREHGCTFFNYVGRSLAYVLATPPTDHDLDNRLRLGFGTEASSRDMDAFQARFGCPLMENYGSSEGAISIRRTPDTPRGALGIPPEGMPVAILDEDGNECPRARFDEHGALVNGDEAIGEIVGTQAAASFEGYYNNAEAETLRVIGASYRTGDLGYRDEDGWFWFAGRGADWLRVDSENFAAAPIETILSRWDPVVMVAVYPVPDAQTGDQVMAALELSGPFDADGFAAFLADQQDLGTKWAPRYVRVVEAMPLTGRNKVDKNSIRREQWTTGD
ncbi:MAG: AMP-binding protein, partial [Frankiales bacterium]|nr:AMP-binding protein [Frankiales bacterium]